MLGSRKAITSRIRKKWGKQSMISTKRMIRFIGHARSSGRAPKDSIAVAIPTATPTMSEIREPQISG